MLGAPIMTWMPARCDERAASTVVGNSATGYAVGDRLLDMLGRGVVVAGQRNPIRMRELHEPAPMRIGEALVEVEAASR